LLCALLVTTGYVADVYGAFTSYETPIPRFLYLGWKELGGEVESIRKSMPVRDTYVAGPYFFLVDELAYNGKAKAAGYTIAFRVYEPERFRVGSSYPPYVPIEKLKGKDMVFVDEKRNPEDYDTPPDYWVKKLKPYFNKVKGPITFTERKKGKQFRTFYIFKCFGFKGPDSKMDHKGDIREYLHGK
jgi:hypothetical protein